MPSYKDASTVLDAYHQLERGHRLGGMKAAAKRLRLFDPAKEILPELEAKIAAMVASESAVVRSRRQHDRHHA
jgi:hypothetical protein